MGMPPLGEEEWSLNREPLYRQIDQILADAPDWRRQNGLWLGDFPLWLLERPDPEQLLPADSFGARLQDGALIDPAPLPERDDIQGEANVLAPLPLDGGQMSALRYVLEGNSLIAEGHHGTGKTQLAAALMANAIGDRKRVLLVSPSVADRRSALERMEEMGLDRLCLSLPVRGDSRRTVLHQFNVAAQLRPTTAAEDYFSLAAAVLSLSGQLDRTAADLHTPCRCGLTPFELVCRYSEEREAEGYLPISEHVAAELDPDGLSRRLSCIDDLTDAAGALGTPWNHPLALIQGETYDPERAAQLPQAEDALRSAIFRLNEAAWTWLDETGVTRPSTREDWGKLAQAARLLVKWRDYPDHWADSPRVPLLSDTVQELKSRTDLADKLRREIAEQWGEDILSLDAVSLEQQWKFHKAEWSLPSEPDRESAFRRLSVEAEALLNRLEQCGRRWSKCVNVPVPGTRDSWERYYEVAVELARWKEIPSEWGSCKGLQALLWDVGELIDAGKQAKESKEVLLRDWTEAFLSQNGKELLADWETEGGSWGLGLLKRQNSTRAVIEPFCKTKLTTDLAESGLRWLADYQEELAQCDEIYHRWERELRSVYRREETVWVWLEAARRVAAESHDWLSELTGSEDFLLRYGSDREAVAAAGELQELWERSREVLGRLDVMIGRTGQPDSKDWLSDRRNDCRRLRNLIKIRNHLEELATEPVPLGEIAGVLSALARRQREEEALDALYHRWEHELAGLYEGTETDWDTLYPLSLQAVESDDRIAENTGDLELRAKFARNEEILSLSAELADARGSGLRPTLPGGGRLARRIAGQQPHHHRPSGPAGAVDALARSVPSGGGAGTRLLCRALRQARPGRGGHGKAVSQEPVPGAGIAGAGAGALPQAVLFPPVRGDPGAVHPYGAPVHPAHPGGAVPRGCGGHSKHPSGRGTAGGAESPALGQPHGSKGHRPERTAPGASQADRPALSLRHRKPRRRPALLWPGSGGQYSL